MATPNHKKLIKSHPLAGYGAGMIGGITRTLVSYPFDTVKVLLQSQKNVHLSPERLYQGVAVPLASNVFISGLMLGMQRNLHQMTDNHAFSGFCTGIVMSVMTSPLDYLKIQQQINSKMQRPGQKIFSGMKACALKEAVSGAVFFGEYDRMKSCKRHPAVCGAWAGICATVVSHPVDVIKTRIQCGISFRDAIAMREFHSGLAVCCLKAAIMNAAAYAAINLFTGDGQTKACPEHVLEIRKPQQHQRLSIQHFSHQALPGKRILDRPQLDQSALLSPGRDITRLMDNQNPSGHSGLLCETADLQAKPFLSPVKKP